MALTFFKIPLSNTPQTFPIVLAGTTYTMTSKWNDMESSWVIDIADENQVPIIANIPLVTGADLLEGLGYLGINGSLYVQTSGSDFTDVPTLDNLGVDSNLYFATEVASV